MLSLLFPCLLAQGAAWSPAWRSPTLGTDVREAPRGVLVGQASPARTTAHPRAVAALPTTLGERWSLSFEVVYRSLGESGGRVAIERGGRKLLWTGADADYVMMSSFVGEGMVDTRAPEIGRTYRFTLRREGGVGSVLLDGRLLGQGAMPANPDSLFVGGDDSSVLATSTVLEVRNVVLQDGAASPEPARLHALPPLGGERGDDLLRLVLGADSTVPPPAVPSGDRLRLSTRESRLLLPPGALLEVSPLCERPDFRPSEVALAVDGRIVERRKVHGEALPTFSRELPRLAGSRLRIQVLAADDAHRQAELLRTDVEVSAGSAVGPSATLEGERLRVSNAGGGALYAFLGDRYLGRVDDAGRFSLDVRRLPPGQRELRFVATNAEGALLAPFRTLLDVRPRYRLESDADHGTLRLEGDVTGTTLRARVVEGGGPATTRVYLRGQLVATSRERAFECALPLGDVPSGETLVEAVGVGEDGAVYPAESLTLRVSNPLWDARRARDERAKRLDALLSALGKDDEDAAYWYARALAEPAFRTVARARVVLAVDELGRSATLAYVESFTAPGEAGRCLGECRAAIARRAAHRLELGRLQRALGLRERARATLARCVEEAGEASGTGAAARAELSGL